MVRHPPPSPGLGAPPPPLLPWAPQHPGATQMCWTGGGSWLPSLEPGAWPRGEREQRTLPLLGEPPPQGALPPAWCGRSRPACLLPRLWTEGALWWPSGGTAQQSLSPGVQEGPRQRGFMGSGGSLPAVFRPVGSVGVGTGWVLRSAGASQEKGPFVSATQRHPDGGQAVASPRRGPPAQLGTKLD